MDEVLAVGDELFQPRRDVDRVSQRREYNRIAIADVAGNHLSCVDADPEADWIALGFGEHLVQMVHIAGNHRGSIERLPASRRPIGIEPEQSQKPVADILVRLATSLHYCLRDRRQEAVDDEHGIERQPLLRHFG